MVLKSLVLSALVVGSLASTAVFADPVSRKTTGTAAPALNENYRRMFCGDQDQPDTPMGYSVAVSAELDRLMKPKAGKALTIGQALEAMRVRYCGGGQS
jgi:hypothetical protein